MVLADHDINNQTMHWVREIYLHRPHLLLENDPYVEEKISYKLNLKLS